MHANMYGGNPSPTGLLDAALGKAFAAVQLVADNIETIKDIAENIVDVKNAARNKARNLAVVEGDAPALNATSFTALPNTIAAANVLDYSVIVTASNGSKYPESTGHFTTVLRLGFLELTLKPTAPAAMANGDITWSIYHQE